MNSIAKDVPSFLCCVGCCRQRLESRMLHLGTRLTLFSLGSGEPENTKCQSLKPSQTPQDFPKYVRYVAFVRNNKLLLNFSGMFLHL